MPGLTATVSIPGSLAGTRQMAHCLAARRPAAAAAAAATAAAPAWRAAAAAPRELQAGSSHAAHRRRCHCAAGSGDSQGPGAPPPGEQQQQRPAAPAAPMDPNVWASKPAWCQPWSILATGAGIVGGAWGISGGSPWWTALAALPIGAWWVLFLVLYPTQYREYAEEVNAEAAAAAQRAQR